MFFKTEITIQAEDDMIEDGNPEQPARLLKASGRFNIVTAGLDVARGMVMSDDDGSGSVFQRI